MRAKTRTLADSFFFVSKKFVQGLLFEKHRSINKFLKNKFFLHVVVGIVHVVEILVFLFLVGELYSMELVLVYLKKNIVTWQKNDNQKVKKNNSRDLERRNSKHPQGRFFPWF